MKSDDKTREIIVTEYRRNFWKMAQARNRVTYRAYGPAIVNTPLGKIEITLKDQSL